MKPEDLRIGNWVLNSNNEWDITHNDFVCAYLFEPIPLSESWLVELGFESKRINLGWDGWYIKGLHIGLKDNKLQYPVSTLRPFELKYVHQLQNLYHSLTGQELKRKEEEETP